MGFLIWDLGKLDGDAAVIGWRGLDRDDPTLQWRVCGVVGWVISFGRDLDLLIEVEAGGSSAVFQHYQLSSPGEVAIFIGFDLEAG